MKKSTAIKLCGSSTNLAYVLNVSRAAVSRWGDDIPAKRVHQLCGVIQGYIIEKQLNDNEASAELEQKNT